MNSGARSSQRTQQADAHKAKVRRRETQRTLAAPLAVPQALRHALPPDGRPLEDGVRAQMESRFGEDFGHVRIHADMRAADHAARLDANAYTLGEHIVFDEGRYAPDTVGGRRLLAHELAHVVQQRRGGSTALAHGDAALESQADAAAQSVAAGANVHVGGAAAPGVMCDRSGRKPPRRDDGDEEGIDDHGAEEAARRVRERQRTTQRKQARDVAGKDDGQILAEDAENRLKKMEGEYDDPGAKRRSPRRKRKELTQFEERLNETGAPEIDKSKRKGAYDERQRTPNNTAGKPQTKHVAGGPELPGMELEAGRAKYAQPDYSIYARDSKGRLTRLHVNLKSDRIDRLTPGEAGSRAREYYYQAMRNTRHLADGERVIISFARVPNREVQQAIMAELFREGGPVAEVRFGTTVHRDADYSGKRKPADVSPQEERKRKDRERKAEARRIAAEKKAKARERKQARAAEKKKRDAEKKEKRRERERARKDAARKREAEKKAQQKERQRQRADAKQQREAKKKAERDERARQRAEAKKQRDTQKKAEREKRAQEREAAKQRKADAKPKGGVRGTRKPAASTEAPAKGKPSGRVRISSEIDPGPPTPVRVGTKVRVASPDHAAEREQQAELEAEEALRVPRAARPRRRSAPPAPSAHDDAATSTRDVAKKPAPRRAGSKKAVITPAPDATQPLLSQQQPGSAPRKTAPALLPRSQGQLPVAPTQAPGAQPKPRPAAPPQPVAPVQAKPAPTKPVQTKPVQTKPVQTKPVQAKPVQTKPVQANVQPTPAKPVSAKPAANKRAPQKKTPAVSAHNKAPAPPATAGSKQHAPQKPAPAKKGPPAGKAAPSRLSTQTKSFFNDQVKVSVSEVFGASDKPYRVTTTISVRAGGTFGASHDSGASGHASASGAVTTSYTAPMNEQEKNAYLAAIAGGRGGPQPEMPIIELIAQGRIDDAAKVIERTRRRADPQQAFAQRSDGDVVEESTEGDASIGAGGQRKVGSGGSVGGQIEFSKGGGVRITSRRVSDHEEILTVTVSSRDGRTLGVSGGYGVASMGYSDTRGSERERAITFRLDPSKPGYAALQARIRAATTAQELDAIAQQNPSLVSGRSRNDVRSDGGTISAAVAGFGFDIDSGGSYGEGEIIEDGQRIRTVSGSGKFGGSFTAGGRRINPSSDTDTFTGYVTDDNVGSGETRSDQQEVNVARTVGDLYDSFSAHPGATVVGLVRGNKPVLQERTNSSGKTLDDDSYAQIAAAAQSPKTWLAAWSKRGVARGAAAEWEATRQKVLAANGDRYQIAQAMSQWEKGDSGRSGDVERLTGGTGVVFEFPDEVASEKPAYEALVVANPVSATVQLAADGNKAQAIQELQSIEKRLERLSQNVQMHHGAFTDPTKFDKMQELIGARRKAVRAELRRLAPPVAASNAANQPTVEPLPAGFVGPPTPDQQAAANAAALAERKEASERIGELVLRCLTNRDVENKVFAEAAEELDSFFINRGTLFNKLNSLKGMYGTWDNAISELKTLYPKIGDPPDRADQFQPNRARWDQLNRQGLK
ncbi:MAG: DUF4157 domain-containing protein [Rhodanobacteraceae bacterium]|nr:DUF4157 domain-containing protein [Rhodanobacteraceae bacterium]